MAEIIEIQQGDTVNFIDKSKGDIVEYNWSFPGGTPSFSNTQNPVITYNNVGIYDVSLKTKDSNDIYSTEKKQKIIKVIPRLFKPDFHITSNTISLRMGEEFTIINDTIGEPVESEWHFPNGSEIVSPILLNGPSSLDSIGPIKYINWLELTGSHYSSIDSIFKGKIKLLSHSNFSSGSKTKKIEILKRGPLEEIYEIYDYLPVPYNSNFEYGGKIYSSVYGYKSNELINEGRKSGITYSFIINTESINNPGEYIEPYLSDDNSAFYKIKFDSGFPINNFGITGPNGTYFPHVEGEQVIIRGRAFSPFNMEYGGKYISNNIDTFYAIGGTASGKTLGENISKGKYTSNIIAGLNEVVNPDFILIKDSFNDLNLDKHLKSYLTHYISKNIFVQGKEYSDEFCIPYPTINKLMQHPIQLPKPGNNDYGSDDIPTLGMVTSADIHLSSVEELVNGSWARFYINTNEISLNKSNVNDIGKYPCIPSQYILPVEPGISYIGLTGANNIPYSSVPPLGIDMEIEYWNDTKYTINIYFGLPDENGRLEGDIKIPDKIDPNGSYSLTLGITGSAQAYGNDSYEGSWILPHDTPFGIGIASYINAYIDDINLGLPGGTKELVAICDEYFTLPTPYSDSLSGSIIPKETYNHIPGISIEIKNPMIKRVKIKESYGEYRLGLISKLPFYDYVDKELLNIPITWDFGRCSQNNNIDYPKYINIEEFSKTKYSYLGISSNLGTSVYGPLGLNHSKKINNVGIQIGDK